MSTTYEEVYEHFLSSISDYNLANFTDEQLDEQMEKYLINSLPKFTYCKKDLNNRDEIMKQFNETLTLEERSILGHIMVLQWLKPQIYNIELLRENFSTREFQLLSSSNKLDKLLKLKQDTLRDLDDAMAMYYYTN